MVLTNKKFIDLSRFGAWNIRGLNDPLKQREILSFVKAHKLCLMGIVEAKVRPEYLGSTCSHCFPGHWSFVHNTGTTSVARIIVGWDPSVFQLDVIFSSPQIICMKATFGDLSSIFLSMIYGLNQALGRKN